MPSRTYTAIDLINVTHEASPDDDIAITALETGNAGVTISGNKSGSFPDQGAESSHLSMLYTILANLDFTLFPTIPEDALISRVEVSFDASISGTANASAGGTNASSGASASASVKAFRDTEEMVNLTLADEDFPTGNGATSASISAFDHYTADEIFDYSGAPITKAQFEALFTNLQFTIDFSINASASQIVD